MKLSIRFKGSSSSGNFGHRGRPGKVGGSSGSGGNIIVSDKELGRGTSATNVNVKLSKEYAKKYQCTESVCYRNAQKVVTGESSNLTYNEGIFVTVGEEPRYIDHAWASDEDGIVIDPSFHKNGVYYPIIQMKKDDLKKYPATSKYNDRKLTDLKAAGLSVSYSKLQDVVFDKSIRQLLKDFGANPKDIDTEGAFDYRVMK